MQTERLPRESGVALFLVGILTDLTGQLAPRAVARNQAERETLRAHRRQHQCLRCEKAQGSNGQRGDELAVDGRQGDNRRKVEFAGHASLLCHRSRGVIRYKWVGSPARKPRRRFGDADPGGGERRRRGSNVSSSSGCFSQAIRGHNFYRGYNNMQLITKLAQINGKSIAELFDFIKKKEKQD